MVGLVPWKEEKDGEEDRVDNDGVDVDGFGDSLLMSDFRNGRCLRSNRRFFLCCSSSSGKGDGEESIGKDEVDAGKEDDKRACDGLSCG